MDSLNPVWPSPSAAKKMVSRLLPHKGVLIADRIKTMNKPAPAIQGRDASSAATPGATPPIWNPLETQPGGAIPTMNTTNNAQGPADALGGMAPNNPGTSPSPGSTAAGTGVSYGAANNASSAMGSQGQCPAGAMSASQSGMYDNPTMGPPDPYAQALKADYSGEYGQGASMEYTDQSMQGPSTGFSDDLDQGQSVGFSDIPPREAIRDPMLEPELAPDVDPSNPRGE